jgi:hypothetical protein
MLGAPNYCAQPHNQGIPYAGYRYFRCFAANANRLLKQMPESLSPPGVPAECGIVAMRRFIGTTLYGREKAAGLDCVLRGDHPIQAFDKTRSA